MLGYEFDIIDLGSVMKEEENNGVEHEDDAFDIAFSMRLDEQLDNPQLLGVLVTESTHWVCISKYSNLCKKDEGYALIDSIKRGIKRVCRNKAELMSELAKYEPVGVIFIYARSEDAYLSKAVKKMRALAKKGGVRKTRKARGFRV
jgi:hypothetical protein